MANEDSVLREVDQELAEDRQWEMFRKQGPLLIGGALAIVIAVAGWQLWNAHKASVAKGEALEFKNAVELLAEDQGSGLAALGAVSEEGGGYGILAQLHRAASYARAGEGLKAAQAYRDIYNDSAAPKRVREFARLRAAYMALAEGRDQVLADLGGLTQAEGLYGVYAQEIAAIAAMGAKDYETSLSIFRKLAVDISAPQPVRTRAEDFAALAAAGKAGVNIAGETQVEDLIKAVGGAPDDDGAEILPPPEIGETVIDSVEKDEQTSAAEQNESDTE